VTPATIFSAGPALPAAIFKPFAAVGRNAGPSTATTNVHSPTGTASSRVVEHRLQFRRHFSLKCDGRPCGWHLSKRWERINLNHGKGINHEEDQIGDCRARDRGAGGCALCCRSEETQASLAQCFDNAIRNLWNGRNLDHARNLRVIRSFCWNCHRSVNRLVQLAVGRRDKRSPDLEQH
jgi:hypothetical protein